MIVAKPHNSIPIVEIFSSIQGEGRFMGCPVCFVRTAGCDIGCSWCDTKYSWNADEHQLFSICDIVGRVEQNIEKVVITGGEPLMWNLDELCNTLKRNKKRIHIETSGAYPISGIWDWITLSPKKNRMPNEDIYKKANELKIVIDDKDDFSLAEYCRDRVGLDCFLYLQPQWYKKKKILPMILDYINDNPHWNLSFQAHKMVNVK